MSTAHKGAWKAGILHRDISVNNIMRVVDQEAENDNVVKGILSDWDLAKYEHQRSKEATQDCRSVSLALHIITICRSMTNCLFRERGRTCRLCCFNIH